MNKDMMKKNVYVHVLLQPPANWLDQNGLPAKAPFEDRWIVTAVRDEGVEIANRGYSRLLGYDHINKFTSDGTKGGNRLGFLTLNVQVTVQGMEVRIEPTRPGVAISPKTPQVIDKLVDLRYPVDSGLQARIEASGYRVAWALESRLSRLIDLEGYELVIEPDRNGVLCSFRVKDRPIDQVLVKCRSGLVKP
jgi:hypothetical protein